MRKHTEPRGIAMSEVSNLDFLEDEVESPESQEEAEQVTEQPEEVEQTEPAPNPHDPDKGLQKLQQEFGNFRRMSEEREKKLEEKLEALRREREKAEPEPEPETEPTDIDRLLKASADDVDPYVAPKVLASEIMELKRQLAEERQGREQLSSGFQESQAYQQRQAAESQFRQKYPDFEGSFDDVQQKAYDHLSQQFPDVQDWSQVPSSIFARHANDAVQHVVDSLKPADKADLSAKPPKSTAGTRITEGKPAKKASPSKTPDEIFAEGFFE